MAGIPKIVQIDHIIDHLINRNNIKHEIVTSSQVMFLMIYHIHLLICRWFSAENCSQRLQQ